MCLLLQPYNALESKSIIFNSKFLPKIDFWDIIPKLNWKQKSLTSLDGTQFFVDFLVCNLI